MISTESDLVLSSSTKHGLVPKANHCHPLLRHRVLFTKEQNNFLKSITRGKKNLLIYQVFLDCRILNYFQVTISGKEGKYKEVRICMHMKILYLLSLPYSNRITDVKSKLMHFPRWLLRLFISVSSKFRLSIPQITEVTTNTTNYKYGAKLTKQSFSSFKKKICIYIYIEYVSLDGKSAYYSNHNFNAQGALI